MADEWRGGRGDGTARQPSPTGDAEHSLRLLRALAELDEAQSPAGSLRSDVERAAAIVNGVIPGIDLVATWQAGDSEVAVHVAGPRSGLDRGQLPCRLPFAPVAEDGPLSSRSAVIFRRNAPADWPPALLTLADWLALRTVVVLPYRRPGGSRRGGVLAGSHSNRAFSPIEVAFLQAAALHIARRLEVRRARANVEAERARLRAVIASLPEALLLVNQDGSVQTVNSAAEELLGSAGGERSLAGYMERFRPRTGDGRPMRLEETPLARALAGETVRGVEMMIELADGRDGWVVASAVPMLAAEGSASGAILLVQDISRFRELDRLKDEFINTVSHELRTPTTTIRGGALTLAKRGDMLDPDVRRQLLQDIAEESERLHHLVEDLLSMTRTRAGMLLNPEPVRLHRVVSKVLVGLGGRLGSHPVSVDVPPDLPVAEADPLALEQVLRNLIENAARHSPRGGRIEVSARAAGSGQRATGNGQTPIPPPTSVGAGGATEGRRRAAAERGA